MTDKLTAAHEAQVLRLMAWVFGDSPWAQVCRDEAARRHRSPAGRSCGERSRYLAMVGNVR